MSRGLKKVWNVFTTLIVIAALIPAVLLAGVRLTGLRVYAVLSGSMEPAYPTGSIIYVKETDPLKLKTGDVICFKLNEKTLVTHRIAAIVPEEGDPSAIRFRTKGDANRFEDGSLVEPENIVGVPVFTIPKLGWFANYIQHPPGLYAAAAAGAFLLLLMLMPELVSAVRGDEEQKEKHRKKSETHSEIAKRSTTVSEKSPLHDVER